MANRPSQALLDAINGVPAEKPAPSQALLDAIKSTPRPDAYVKTTDGRFGVSDGDTIQDYTTGKKMRLADINTQEISHGTTGGTLAGYDKKQVLLDYLNEAGPNVEIQDVGEDKYGRRLVHINTPNGSLNNRMVAEGHAIRFMDDDGSARRASIDADLLPYIPREYTNNELREITSRPVKEDHYYKTGDFKKALIRGTDQTQAMLYGALDVAGKISGVDALSEYAQEGIERNSQEIAENPARVGTLDNIDGIGDFATYVVEAIGEQIPQLGLDLASAATGVGVATALGRRAALRKALQAGPINEEISKAVKNSLALKGAKAGGASAIYAQSMGETQMELLREGIDSPGTAMAVGGVKAGLEYFGISSMLKGLSRSAGIAEGSLMQMANQVSQRALGTSFVEAGTEGAQTILDFLAVGLHTPEYDIFSEDNLKELKEAVAQGAIVGGTFRGVGETAKVGLKGLSDWANTEDAVQPEADIDVFAQAEAVKDGSKRAVHVTSGSPLAQHKAVREILGKEAFAVEKPDGSTLYTLDEQTAIKYTNDEIALDDVLNYTQPKSEVRNPETAVATEVQDENGAVVHSEVHDADLSPIVEEKLQGDLKEGQRIVQRTPEEAIDLRVQRGAEPNEFLSVQRHAGNQQRDQGGGSSELSRQGDVVRRGSDDSDAAQAATIAGLGDTSSINDTAQTESGGSAVDPSLGGGVGAGRSGDGGRVDGRNDQDGSSGRDATDNGGAGAIGQSAVDAPSSEEAGGAEPVQPEAGVVRPVQEANRQKLASDFYYVQSENIAHHMTNADTLSAQLEKLAKSRDRADASRARRIRLRTQQIAEEMQLDHAEAQAYAIEEQIAREERELSLSAKDTSFNPDGDFDVETAQDFDLDGFEGDAYTGFSEAEFSEHAPPPADPKDKRARPSAALVEGKRRAEEVAETFSIRFPTFNFTPVRRDTPSDTQAAIYELRISRPKYTKAQIPGRLAHLKKMYPDGYFIAQVHEESGQYTIIEMEQQHYNPDTGKPIARNPDTQQVRDIRVMAHKARLKAATIKRIVDRGIKKARANGDTREDSELKWEVPGGWQNSRLGGFRDENGKYITLSLPEITRYGKNVNSGQRTTLISDEQAAYDGFLTGVAALMEIGIVPDPKYGVIGPNGQVRPSKEIYIDGPASLPGLKAKDLLRNNAAHMADRERAQRILAEEFEEFAGLDPDEKRKKGEGDTVELTRGDAEAGIRAHLEEAHKDWPTARIDKRVEDLVLALFGKKGDTAKIDNMETYDAENREFGYETEAQQNIRNEEADRLTDSIDMNEQAERIERVVGNTRRYDESTGESLHVSRHLKGDRYRTLTSYAKSITRAFNLPYQVEVFTESEAKQIKGMPELGEKELARTILIKRGAKKGSKQYIILKEGEFERNEAAALMLVGHEVGHTVFKHWLDSKPHHMTKKMLKRQFEKDSADYLARYPNEQEAYEEWFADRTSAYFANRAIRSEESPEKNRDWTFKVFPRLVAKLKQIFRELVKALPPEFRKRFKSNEKFDEFMNRILEKNALQDTTIDAFEASYTPLRRAIREANSGNVLNTLRTKAKQVARFGLKAVSPILTADRQLRRISVPIADLFFQQSQTDSFWGETGLFNVLSTKRSRWIERLKEVESQYSTEVVAEGYDQLQRKVPRDQLNPFGRDMRRFLAEYYIYAKQNAKTLGHLDDYFHRWWDVEQIRERPEEFEQMLGELGYERPAEIRRKLEEGLGSLEFNIEEFETAYGPGAAARKERALERENTDSMAADRGFLMKDPAQIMRFYLTSMTKRVEWEKRVGGYRPVRDWPGDLDGSFPEARELAEVTVQRSIAVPLVHEGFLVEDWHRSPDAQALFNDAVQKAREQGYLEWNGTIEDHAGWYDPNYKFSEEKSRLPAPEQAKVKQIVDAYMGRIGQDMNAALRKSMSGVLAYESYLTLFFSALASIPDLAGPIINSKDFQGVKNAFKAYVRTAEDRAEAVRRAHELGTIYRQMTDQSLLELAGHQHSSGMSQKAMEFLFKWNGQEALTQMSRVLATSVGENFLKDSARRAAAGDAKARRYLNELNVSHEIVNRWVRDGAQAWSPALDARQAADAEAVMDAIGQFVDSSIVRPNAAHRPIWASDPRFMLIWHLKSFFYSYGKVIMGGIYREMKTRFKEADGNAMQKGAYAAFPLLMAAALLLPLAAAGLELREVIQYWGDDPTEHSSAADYALNITSRAGMFGVLELGGAFFGLGSHDSGPMAIAGPTVQHIDVLFNGKDETKLTRSVPVVNQVPPLKEKVSDFF